MKKFKVEIPTRANRYFAYFESAIGCAIQFAIEHPIRVVGIKVYYREGNDWILYATEEEDWFKETEAKLRALGQRHGGVKVVSFAPPEEKS